ncbi:MAG: right-handed parallel beta-helix repeat-containing protein [Myxococcales bacterium]|nr:right-handed parallel beta-helix repeat-containing protein [Myxococcales bacterium]
MTERVKQFPASVLVLVGASLLCAASAGAMDLSAAERVLDASIGGAVADRDGEVYPLARDEFGVPLTDSEGRFIALPDGEAQVADALLTLQVVVGSLALSEPVNHEPPSADAGPDLDVDAGEAVVISGAGEDPEGAEVSFAWSQVSGLTVDLGAADAATLNFQAPPVAPESPPETIVLRLTSSDGLRTATDDVDVVVRPLTGPNSRPRPPVPDAGADQTVDEGSLVTLDGTGTTDANEDTLTYEWRQLAGPAVALSDSSSVSPTFTTPDVTADTDLIFELSVSDLEFLDETDSVTVTVRFVNQAPVADAGSDQSVSEGAPVTLDASASSDPDGQTLAFAWTQVSGPAATLSDATSATPSFTAPDVAVDEVLAFEVAVTDGTATANDTVEVSVHFDNDAPVADAGVDLTVDEGARVTLDASASTDPNEQPLTFSWTQLSGPPVLAPEDITTATPSFTAPDVTADADVVVEVTVSDGELTATDSLVVHVRFTNQAPVADAGADQAVDEGEIVTLDGSGSADPDGQTLTHAWTQLSGPAVSLSDTAAAAPTFTAPDITADATVVLELTVSDGDLTSTDTVSIDVSFVNQAPVADAGADQAVDEGAPATLDGSASTDPDGQALSFSWIQLSGAPVSLAGSTTDTPSFTAPDVTADTALVFELTASDGTLTSTDTVQVNVVFVNQAPIADAGADTSANAESLEVLDGSGSFDPDGQTLTYSWTQTSGPLVALSSATTASPSFTTPTVTADTTLEFTLTVSDGEFQASDAVSVTVLFVNSPPTADAGADQVVTSGAIVQLDGTASADPDGDPLGYAWTQVAGTTVTILDATTATPRFVAPSVDADTIVRFQLSVTDGAASATDTVEVTIDWVNTPPVANAGADKIVGIGDVVVLQGGASFDPDGQPITYQWAQVSGWPAGALANNVSATSSFTAPFVIGDQTLTFRLTVSDGESATTDDVKVKVLFINLPPIAIAGPDQTVDERTAVSLSGVDSVDLQGQPITYSWVQSSGPAVALSGAETATPSFPGIEVTRDEALTFTLTVSDGPNNSSDSVVVTIRNVSEPPVADAGPDQTVEGGAAVQLDASATSDPDGDDLTYAWVQTAGTAVVLDDDTSPTPTFTAPAPTVDEALTFELTVDDGLYQATDSVEITVLGNVAPVADAGADQSLPEGSTVTLDGTASADANGDTIHYAWSQVSGPSVALTGSDTAEPTFTLPNVTADTALVFALVVSDAALSSAADQVTVTALFVNQAPVANAGGDQSVVPGTQTSLDGTLSSDPDGQSLTYAWTQTAGPAGSLGNGTSATPTLQVPTVTEDTDLVFELTVSDGSLSATDSVTITASVSNIPPTADAGADQTADEQTSITLDGGASADPEGQPLTYIWEQETGSAATIADPTSAVTSVTLPNVTSDETLVFRLTVDDGTFSGSDEVSVHVTFVNQAPTASAGADQSVNEGTLVTLTGSASADPDGQPLTYAWTQTAGPVVTLSGTAVPNPTFTAPDVSEDTTLGFSLTVTDDQEPGLSSTDSVDVTVRFVNRAPIANAGPDQTVAPEALVVLDGSGSTDPDGQPITYAWTQTSGDPVTLTGASGPAPSFTAMQTLYDKDLTFQLTVSDGILTHADAVAVRVDYPNVAPVASAGADQTVTEGDAVTLDATGSSDADGHPLTFQWIQTQGPTVTLLAPQGNQAGFTAPEVNEDTTFVFQVTVSDGELIAYDQVTIVVENVNQAPVADAGLDQTVTEGDGVLLSAAASHDPDGAALTYAWTQTSGPSVTLAGGDAVEATFTAPDVATPTDLVFAVHVSDGELIDDDAVTITVEPRNGAPTADAGPDQSLAEGATVTLDGSASADPDGDTLSFAWTQIFGPPVTLSDAAAQQPTFTAPEVTQDLTLIFHLEVSDGDAAAVDTVEITVTNGTGTTIYVDAANASGVEDGSLANPWNTIAEALVAALDGDVIEVAAGTYVDPLTIDKSVAIRAPGGATAVTVNSGAATVVDSASQVTLDGLTFTGSATDGLRVLSSDYVTIANCVAEANAHNGLYASDSFGLSLLDSTFRSNGADTAGESNGALVVDSDYLTVRGSTFDANGLADTHAPPATVTAVTDVHGNGLAVEAASRIDVSASIFTGNHWVGMFLNPGAGAAGVSLDSLTVSGNDGAGVVLTNATLVTLTNSTIELNGPDAGDPDSLFGGHGVGMVGVTGVTISGTNAIRQNRGTGVVWGLGDFSSDITIDGASITDNDGMGVGFDFSSSVTITGATITGNASFGVGLRASSSVEITANTIDLNGDSGVAAINSSFEIAVHDNVSIGSNADYGIECATNTALTCAVNNLNGNTTGAINGCGAACVD